MNIFQRIEWRIYKEIKRLRLKNRTASIISANCNGTFIYHDMKLRFLSPTINLSFDMNDFVKFAGNLKYYLSLPLTEIDDPRFDFPCGMLGDIEIRFNHYKSFDEAFKKWKARKERLNLDNIYIIGSDRDGCSYDTIKKFEGLPFKNKVIFTHKPYPEFSSAYYIKGFENEECVGVLSDFTNRFFVRRYLDSFDYVTFLNRK